MTVTVVVEVPDVAIERHTPEELAAFARPAMRDAFIKAVSAAVRDGQHPET